MWVWWILGTVIVGFLIVMLLALCKAQEPISPEEELRLIREQQEERLRKARRTK